ncbi:MAG TPA: hypothetical protein VGM27_27390 [Acidobacteriaceae bacterium]
MRDTYELVEVPAAELANLTIEAHGGLKQWKRFTTVAVHGINGGVLWGAKGKTGVLDDVTVTVDLRNERVSHWPFGSPDRRSRFEPQRVALENANGEVVEELLQPRSSFRGHTLETPWSDLQLAYFAGCAMWTYLNIPFLLLRPGVESEEVEPWQEAGETWRRLKVRFPADIATHSREQTLYFDRQGLLKRHDYDVEISGGTAAAHYVSDLKEFSGIVFPTRRRIFPRKADGHSAPEPLIVSIDMDQIVLS